MPITIEKADSPAQMKAFIDFPYALHKGTPWVPYVRQDTEKMLSKTKNPFFQHSDADFFLARRDGAVVGRICAIENREHNRFHNEHIGFFGWWEVVDDVEVTRALIAAAEAWCRERKLTAMRGPASYSSNDEFGLLVEGNDAPPVFLNPWHPKYYGAHLEALGYAKAKDLLGFTRPQSLPLNETIVKLAERVKKHHPNLSVRTIDMSRLAEEVELIRGLYNAAWENNWGFVPMTAAEFDAIVETLRQIVIPEMVVFVEGPRADDPTKKEVAGWLMTLPDINPVFVKMGGSLFPFGWATFLWEKWRSHGFRDMKVHRLITLGIVPKWRNKGVDALLYERSWRNSMECGFESCDFSWVLEDNERMLAALIKSGGAVLYKRFRIYEKPL